MNDPRLQHLGVSLHSLQPNGYQHGFSQPLDPELEPASFEAYGLESLASVANSSNHLISQNNGFAQPRQSSQLALQTRSRVQSRPHMQSNEPNGDVNTLHNTSQQHNGQAYNPRSSLSWGLDGTSQPELPQQSMYTPAKRLQQQPQLAPVSSPIDSTLKQTSSRDENSSHFSNMRMEPDPPNLASWREKLFNIVSPITLAESEFQTYFPHVDNVYSHRSTQKYKRKPFVSHYWDCRLKGRPPGTPKSEDPTKKKRKRNTRERDLCDVKIKITEYFPQTEAERGVTNSSGVGDGSTLTFIMENEGNQPPQPFGMLAPSASLPPGHPGANGARYYVLQRVNGNVGDREDDANLDHKHTLDESDRIKKNSVQRWLLKEEKEKKRSHIDQQPKINPDTSTEPRAQSSSGSTQVSLRASGPASRTASLHSNPNPARLTLFANAFCPFAQRVWIALELKQIAYQYVEVTPPSLIPDGRDGKAAPTGNTGVPRELLEVCPDAIVPCIRQGNWGVWESNVMMEYLEDLDIGHSLLPLGDAKLRAHCRLWVDHINRKILPSFYALLLLPPTSTPIDADLMTNPMVNENGQQRHTQSSGSQQPQQQQQARAPSDNAHAIFANTLSDSITQLVNASHRTGPFFLGAAMSYVDVAFAPWIIRLSRVLSYYRDFPRPEVGTRFAMWVDAIEADERVRNTVSEEGSYHNVYRGVGEEGWVSISGEDLGPEQRKAETRRGMVEVEYARTVMNSEGFGMGGDEWGRMGMRRDVALASVMV